MIMDQLFPEPIGRFNLNRQLTEGELILMEDKLKDLRPNKDNKTTKDTYILDSLELVDLKSFFLNALNEYTMAVYEEQMPLGCIQSPLNLRITQSWLNLTLKGGSHHKHFHPNSFISGVFYVESTQSDRIYFDKNSNIGGLSVDVQEFNKWNATSWWLPATQGTLLLFHSNLMHHVAPTQSEQRVSLSFNTFFDGDFGSHDNLSYVSMS